MSVSNNKKIGIVDYGVGNLYSLRKALREFIDDVIIVENAEEINRLDALILPGVGSFEAGMEGIKARGLERKIKKFAENGKPVLGICLGAQLLLSKGYEFGEFRGLDIISGKVVKFPELKKGTKIPHIGWNKVMLSRNIKSKDDVLNSIGKNAHVYFVHSYILEPTDKNAILATTIYGGHEFCSVIQKGNIYGFQFHPEKSGQVGLGIIKNFINLVKAL